MESKIEKIKEYFDNWEIELEKNEWYFTDVRESIINSLNNSEMFLLIPQLIKMAATEENEFLCSEYVEISLDIINKLNTTEITEDMKNDITKLENHTSKFSVYIKNKVSELKKRYRIK